MYMEFVLLKKKKAFADIAEKSVFSFFRKLFIFSSVLKT